MLNIFFPFWLNNHLHCVFQEGEARFLICTDVAARGIDITGIPYGQFKTGIYSWIFLVSVLRLQLSFLSLRFSCNCCRFAWFPRSRNKSFHFVFLWPWKCLRFAKIYPWGLKGLVYFPSFMPTLLLHVRKGDTPVHRLRRSAAFHQSLALARCVPPSLLLLHRPEQTSALLVLSSLLASQVTLVVPSSCSIWRKCWRKIRP